MLTLNPSTYVELPLFCISEWPRGFNFVISLSSLILFGKVKESGAMTMTMTATATAAAAGAATATMTVFCNWM